MMYVVGGYGEAAAGLAFPVRRRSSGRHIIIGGTEPDDCRQIFQLKKKAAKGTIAHFLRASAQQRAVIRQDTSNIGTASPSRGITTELSG